MSDPKPQIEGISIVLLGEFNPPIFQPAWFALHDLIRPEEAESAKIDVIHPEVVSLTIGKIHLQVSRNRYYASTIDPSIYEILRDMTLGAFRLLHHTPSDRIGMNWDLHFGLSSEETWHEVGNRIAPKEPWVGILEKPGMRTLTIEGVRPDKYRGFIRMRIEPSTTLHPGIFININDHYEIESHKPEQGCDAIMNILNSNWDAFMSLARKAASLVTRLT